MNILHALYFLSLHLLTRIRMVTDTLEQNVAPKARERRKKQKKKEKCVQRAQTESQAKKLSQQTPTETQQEQNSGLNYSRLVQYKSMHSSNQTWQKNHPAILFLLIKTLHKRTRSTRTALITSIRSSLGLEAEILSISGENRSNQYGDTSCLFC